MSREIEAAIFDVDGTLLDTREFILSSFEFTLSTHGHEIPDRTIISSQIGKSLPDCYEALIPDGDYDSLRATHREFQSGQIHLISPYKGLTEMLNTLRDAGIKLGVFSSRWGNLIPTLENSGVLDYFGVVIQGNDVQNHKPHPEGLIMALSALAIKPSKAAMIGDAAIDIQAGKAAEVSITIGVSHGFGTVDELESAESDFIVNELQEIPSILINKVNS